MCRSDVILIVVCSHDVDARNMFGKAVAANFPQCEIKLVPHQCMECQKYLAVSKYSTENRYVIVQCNNCYVVAHQGCLPRGRCGNCQFPQLTQHSVQSIQNIFWNAQEVPAQEVPAVAGAPEVLAIENHSFEEAGAEETLDLELESDLAEQATSGFMKMQLR